jgi:hypothetical protein
VLQKSSVRILAATPAILTEDYRHYPESMQVNAGIVLPLCHDQFLLVSGLTARHSLCADIGFWAQVSVANIPQEIALTSLQSDGRTDNFAF